MRGQMRGQKRDNQGTTENPFNFLTDFERWFDYWKARHADGRDHKQAVDYAAMSLVFRIPPEIASKLAKAYREIAKANTAAIKAACGLGAAVMEDRKRRKMPKKPTGNSYAIGLAVDREELRKRLRGQ